MHRLFGAVAILAGWLAVVVGVGLGLAESQFLGLTHTEGPEPALAVYGIGGNIVLWCFVGAALLLMIANHVVSRRPIAAGKQECHTRAMNTGGPAKTLDIGDQPEWFPGCLFHSYRRVFFSSSWGQ